MSDYNLNKIIGDKNKELIFNMQMAIQNKKIFHSYIIHGEPDSGKLFMANYITKLILCENNYACDKCYSCHSFNNKNNPDVFYIKPSKTNSIGIDDIREQIKNQVNIKPYICDYKIFILEDADKMTIPAQNALLKILEEPPSFVIFFLLGENKKNFLPTIISRCVILKTNPIDPYQIKDYLIKNYSLKQELAQIYAVYSHGNLGRAINLVADKNFILLRDEVINLIRGLNNINTAEAMTFVKFFEAQKDNINIILDMIYLWYADLILYFYTKNTACVSNLDKIELIKKDTAVYKNNLYDKIKAVERTKKYLAFNTNFKLSISVMLLELSS